MREESKRLWEIILGILGTILTLAGIFIGITQFNSQQRRNSELEFKREMWKIRSDNYSKLCQDAGVLSSDFTPDSTFQRTLEHFEMLYWGSIGISADQGVIKTLDEFRNTVRHVNHKQPDGHQALIFDLANLVDSCNQSLDKHWNSK